MTGRFSPKTETERLKGFWKPFSRFFFAIQNASHAVFSDPL